MAPKYRLINDVMCKQRIHEIQIYKQMAGAPCKWFTLLNCPHTCYLLSYTHVFLTFLEYNCQKRKLNWLVKTCYISNICTFKYYYKKYRYIATNCWQQQLTKFHIHDFKQKQLPSTLAILLFYSLPVDDCLDSSIQVEWVSEIICFAVMFFWILLISTLNKVLIHFCSCTVCSKNVPKFFPEWRFVDHQVFS